MPHRPNYTDPLGTPLAVVIATYYLIDPAERSVTTYVLQHGKYLTSIEATQTGAAPGIFG